MFQIIPFFFWIYFIVFTISSVVAIKISGMITNKFNQEAYIAITIVTGWVAIILSMMTSSSPLSSERITFILIITVCLFITYNIQSFAVIKTLDPNDTLKGLCITNLIFTCFLLLFTFFKNIRILILRIRRSSGMRQEKPLLEFSEGKSGEVSYGNGVSYGHVIGHGNGDGNVSGHVIGHGNGDGIVSGHVIGHGNGVSDGNVIGHGNGNGDGVSDGNVSGHGVSDVSKKTQDEKNFSDALGLMEFLCESETSEELGSEGLFMFLKLISNKDVSIPDNFESSVTKFLKEKGKKKNNYFNCKYTLDLIKFLLSVGLYKKDVMENKGENRDKLIKLQSAIKQLDKSDGNIYDDYLQKIDNNLNRYKLVQ